MTRMLWAVGLAVGVLAVATSAAQRDRPAGCPPTYTGDLTIWDAARPECPPLFVQGSRR